MQDDNTEPRDNQQINDDNQQAGVAGPRDVEARISNRRSEEDADNQRRVPSRTHGEEGPLD